MIKEVNNNFLKKFYTNIESRFSNDNSEPTLCEQLFDSKIWKKDQNNSNNNNNNTKEEFFGFKPKYFLNKNKKQNIDNNNNNKNYGNNLSSSTSIPSKTKKLPFSLQYKPFGLINRKINTNQNNNNNTNIYNNNNNRQNIVNHNLPKFTQRKNNDNISLLDKIKDKINKENKENKESKNNIPINIKEKSDKYFFNNDEDRIKKNEEQNNKISDDDEDILEKNINMNVIMTKKENNDDEEDILSEEFDEMEESGSNVINTINKINSINVHSNFLKTHYYTGSGFSMNSNNSNSNNSSTIKQKCYTEPDECIIYPKTYQNEPSSGRSNYSGSTNIAQAGSQAVGTDNNSNYFGLYGLNTGYRGYPIKNSFICIFQ